MMYTIYNKLKEIVEKEFEDSWIHPKKISGIW